MYLVHKEKCDERLQLSLECNACPPPIARLAVEWHRLVAGLSSNTGIGRISPKRTLCRLAPYPSQARKKRRTVRCRNALVLDSHLSLQRTGGRLLGLAEPGRVGYHFRVGQRDTFVLSRATQTQCGYRTAAPSPSLDRPPFGQASPVVYHSRFSN